MSEQSEAVKRISLHMRKRADMARRAEKIALATEWDHFADTLDEVSAELIRLANLTEALPSDLGNLHELPQELLEELSVSKTDELEDQLVTVINAYGGEASLDQILVGLYRKFGVMQKRRFTQNKLYRMTKSGLMWSVPGKKGVYSTTEPEGAETLREVAAEALRDDDEIPF